LTTVWHGAAPCPPAVKRGLIDWWGPKITEYYGSTEGSIISTVSSTEWLAKGGSVGKPLDSVEVIVVNDESERVAQGQEGTLYFKNKMGTDFSYHNDEAKTRDSHLEPGVFTTGDVGYIDSDGYLWLSDRKIDMIISGGVNIYPAEIEGVIAAHPAVEDVAVIGVPDEEFGESVKALVQVTEGVTGLPKLPKQSLPTAVNCWLVTKPRVRLTLCNIFRAPERARFKSNHYGLRIGKVTNVASKRHYSSYFLVELHSERSRHGNS